MTNSWRSWAAASAALAFAGAAAAQDETDMAFEDAPEGALEAAQTAKPGVVFSSVSVEVEEGVTTYEFVGTDADGAEFEVDVAKWAVLEVEQIIPVADVPAAVMETLQLQMAGFEPSRVEKSMRGDAVIYEFEGMDADGVEVDVEVQSDGESIIVLDDDET